MTKAVVIGGSAGSFVTVADILKSIPKGLSCPVFVVMHRLRSMKKGLLESVAANATFKVVEPIDEEVIKNGVAYLAPSNYHMLPDNKKIHLSIDHQVNFSRPSIDITFKAIAEMYGKGTIAILLSGANNDGGEGCKLIKEKGGLVVVQDPLDCEVSTMTENAMKQTDVDYVLNNYQIIKFIKQDLALLLTNDNE